MADEGCPLPPRCWWEEDKDSGDGFSQPETLQFDLSIQVRFSLELSYQAAGQLGVELLSGPTF